jgi:tetratricopeptide (TPR) repeat protein
MADTLRLKKLASEYEAKRQPEKALETYREILAAYEAGDESSIDIPFFNRVGELLLRNGSRAEALAVWERAVGHYVAGGFWNPAIALCNKILRFAPERTATVRTLATIYAKKGFLAEARARILEYAARCQREKSFDAACQALREHLELIPEDPDVRRALADILVASGRVDEARAAVDDGVQLGETLAAVDAGGSPLVFLDLEPSSAPSASSVGTRRSTPSSVPLAPPAVTPRELRRLTPPLPPERVPPVREDLQATLAAYEADGDLESASVIAEQLVRIEPDSVPNHRKCVELAARASDRDRVADASLGLADALLAAGDAAAAAPYVSLADLLREDAAAPSARVMADGPQLTGEPEADFAVLLAHFKQGVAATVDDTDYASHHDLGVAYREMGLLDEAIVEFQRALRGTPERLRTLEALGGCFLERGQLSVAAIIFHRALADAGTDDDALVGVLYQLGIIAERQQRFADAKRYFERVFAVDIRFRDVGEHLTVVEQRLP